MAGFKTTFTPTISGPGLPIRHWEVTSFSMEFGNRERVVRRIKGGSGVKVK